MCTGSQRNAKLGGGRCPHTMCRFCKEALPRNLATSLLPTLTSKGTGRKQLHSPAPGESRTANPPTPPPGHTHIILGMRLTRGRRGNGTSAAWILIHIRPNPNMTRKRGSVGLCTHLLYFLFFYEGNIHVPFSNRFPESKLSGNAFFLNAEHAINVSTDRSGSDCVIR